MSQQTEWSVAEAATLDFDVPPLEELSVRIVNGAVNVVGSDEPVTRVQITEVEGPPLIVRREHGRLTVAYDDLPWRGFLKWLDRKGWRRTAVVSVSVPAAARLSVGVVGASAVVSRIAGRVDLKGVSGDSTLVGLSGRVHADTVSGALEAQAIDGEMRFNSVSGSLTYMDGTGPGLKADSVSGDMVVDLAPSAGRTSVRLNTVSGEVAVRLPDDFGGRIELNSASGGVSSTFAELRASGSWGARQLGGAIGSGSSEVRCSTVSAPIAVLRRPPVEFDSSTAPPSASPPPSPKSAARKDI